MTSMSADFSSIPEYDPEKLGFYIQQFWGASVWYLKSLMETFSYGVKKPDNWIDKWETYFLEYIKTYPEATYNEYKYEMLSLLKSDEKNIELFKEFYDEIMKFVRGFISNTLPQDDVQELFIKANYTQNIKSKKALGIMRVLTKRLKTYYDDGSYENRVHRLIGEIIGEQNLPLIKEYLKNEMELISISDIKSKIVEEKREKLINQLQRSPALAWLIALVMGSVFIKDFDSAPGWMRIGLIQIVVTVALFYIVDPSIKILKKRSK